MPGYVVDGGQQVVPSPDKEPALLPGVLQVEGAEVVAEAALAIADHCHQAEVAQLVVVIHGTVLALCKDRPC